MTSPTQFYNALHRMLDGYEAAEKECVRTITGPRYSFEKALDDYQTKERDIAQFMLKNRNMLPPSTLEDAPRIGGILALDK